MKLYDLDLSGNCYKVRLFAALADIDLEIIPVDFIAGAHKQSPVIDLNPWGELPTFTDGDVVLRDSHAILVYLAQEYAAEKWYPGSASARAEIQQWLSTAANEIQHGPGDARLIDKFGYGLDKAHSLVVSERILGLLEVHLASNQWLALGHPSIADCAVMPYIGTAHEGGISLEPYPNIQAWIDRIKGLPGFIPMPGL